MALIQYPERGREISHQASACPECAYPIAEPRPTGKIQRVRTTEDSFLTRNRGFGDNTEGLYPWTHGGAPVTGGE